MLNFKPSDFPWSLPLAQLDLAPFQGVSPVLHMLPCHVCHSRET